MPAEAFIRHRPRSRLIWLAAGIAGAAVLAMMMAWNFAIRSYEGHRVAFGLRVEDATEGSLALAKGKTKVTVNVLAADADWRPEVGSYVAVAIRKDGSVNICPMVNVLRHCVKLDRSGQQEFLSLLSAENGIRRD